MPSEPSECTCEFFHKKYGKIGVNARLTTGGCPVHPLNEGSGIPEATEPPITKPRARTKPTIAPFELTPVFLARHAVYEIKKACADSVAQSALCQSVVEKTLERVFRRVLKLARAESNPVPNPPTT